MNFLILRYFVSCPFVTDTVNVVYEKYYHREPTSKNRHRDDPQNKKITAKEARRIIEQNKMTKVWEDKDGMVWRMDCSKGLLFPRNKT